MHPIAIIEAVGLTKRATRGSRASDITVPARRRVTRKTALRGPGHPR